MGPVYFPIAGMPATLVENHPARRARGGRARICRSSRVVTFDDDRGRGAVLPHRIIQSGEMLKDGLVDVD